MDFEVHQFAVAANHPVDGVADGVHRAVASGCVGCHLLVRPDETDGGGGDVVVAAGELDVVQGITDGLGRRSLLLVHQNLQVPIGNFPLLVGQVLEGLEHLGHILSREGVAQIFQSGLKACPAAELAQHQGVSGDAHPFRLHDFVGGAVFQHAVLVDARCVAESVFPNDGLVGLNGHAGDAADHAAGPVDLSGVGVDRNPEMVLPGIQSHDDFFQRGVAGPLADSVDAALHLAGAELDCDKAVGHGQTQVVVAMDADHHVFDSLNVGLNVLQELTESGG